MLHLVYVKCITFLLPLIFISVDVTEVFSLAES